MTRITRCALAFAFMLGLGAAAPSAGVAQDTSETECTDQYEACLNEAGQKSSPFRELADIECAAEYAGCVLDKFRVI